MSSSSTPNNGPDFSLVAQEIRTAARASNNEEELRTEVERILDDTLEELDVETQRAQEHTTVTGGRIDALYGDVIVEYKDPGTFRTEEGVKEAIYGRDEDDRGLHDYIYESATRDTFRGEDMEEALSKKVGVGLDGEKIFFYRYRAETEVIPVPATQATLSAPDEEELEGSFERIDVSDIERGINRFILYLRSLSRYPLTADALVDEFGLQSEHGATVVRDFYDELTDALENGDPQVETLYQQWDQVFGVVYDPEAGGDRFTHQDDIPEFGGEEVNMKHFLFSAHTYFSIILELIILDLLSSLEDPFVIRDDFLSLTDSELRERLEQLEEGELFRLRGINQFFEGSYFQWYLGRWDDEMAQNIRELVEHLEQFDPATSVIKPETARDILKRLYQDIVPARLRHNLGEYFTPDWLSERVCDTARFEGDLDTRVLDPACGSGTFLVECVKRIRGSVEEENTDISSKKELEIITDSVVGFDINPVSVITAKANYLIALGELALEADGISLPVYNCDSILAPELVSDYMNGRGDYYQITNTAVGEFDIPKLENQSDIQTAMNILSSYIEDDLGPDACLGEMRGKDLELSDEDEEIFRELYSKIKDLKDNKKDSIWPNLLGSAFAPVFEENFDLIVGNPPWVSWDSLSESYKDETESLWEDVGLYETYEGDKDDICFLMTYLSIRRHLTSDGKLCFLLPQSIWQSKEGADDFRTFKISQVGDKSIPISVEKVEDLSSFQPFEATNFTSIGLFQRNKQTEYPVDYRIWQTQDTETPRMTDSWERAKRSLEAYDWAGKPVDNEDARSPWLILPEELIDVFDPIIGDSSYRAREGVNTRGRTGLYRIDIFESDENGLVTIQNDVSEGRKDLPTVRRDVESEVVYPLLRGEDVEGTQWSVNKFIIVPHTAETGMSAIPLEEMAENHSKALDFFREFKETLENRSTYRYAQPGEDVFYQLYEIGPYTFSEYKVVYPHVREEHSATAVGPVIDERIDDKAKPVIPDKQLMTVPVESEDEANYVGGMLNSAVCRLLVNRMMVSTQISTYLVDYFDVPKYDSDDGDHQLVASRYEKLTSNEDDSISEEDVDEAVMNVFELSSSQVDNIYEALHVTEKMRGD